MLVLAAACPAAAFAHSKEPTKRHTAADMRLARSIALTRADFAAGWTQEKSTSSSGGDADCSAQPDESKLIETGSVDPTFDSPNGGAATVDSEVDVYRTKAMALADWRTAQLRALRSCLAELFAKTTGTKVSVTAVARTVPVHAERALAFSFELTAKGGVPYDIDQVAVGKGRATVLLSAAARKGLTRGRCSRRSRDCSRSGSPRTPPRQVTAFSHLTMPQSVSCSTRAMSCVSSRGVAFARC